MRCIYCLNATTGREGEAHIFPEALRQNRDVLPRGAVCDGCNNYLSQLDTALAAHPLISVAIQLFKLPGKKGKPRAKVGNVDRTVKPYGITIPCEEPIPVYDDKGMRTGFTIRPLFSPEFDLDRFRRALHHVAFNLSAAMMGVEEMFGTRYDTARRYVRAPRPGEARGYAQYVVSLAQVDNVVLGGLLESDASRLVTMRLFQTIFVVDLVTTENLHSFVELQDPPGIELVATDAKLPRMKRGKKGARYRFTIVTDESHPEAPD